MQYFYEEKGQILSSAERDRLEYGAHIHEHLELVLLLDGQTKVSVDFKEYTLAKGDVLAVFPNQVHQYHQDAVKRCILLIFPPQMLPDFRVQFSKFAPACPVLSGLGAKNQRVNYLFRQILSLHNNANAYNDTLRKGYLLALMSLVCAEAELVPLVGAEVETIKQILSYCEQHYTDDITLDQLAGQLHLSKFYLSRLFHAKLHMGFREYINMLRTNEACRLLRQSDHSITDIAYMLGYNSTRSFNRAFLTGHAMPPRDYRAQFDPKVPK